MKRIIAFGAVVATVVVLVFASIAVAQNIPDQSGSTQTGPDQGQNPGSGVHAVPAQDTKTVNIHDHAFDPGQLDVSAGTTVTWTNGDTVPHTVTADDGLFDSGTLNPGESYSVWFDGTGTVTYHCKIHPDMKGSVVVGGDGGAGGTTSANPASPPPTQAASVY